MNPTEQKTTVSEAVRKHKEFLFPAVANYYQEPVALVKGEGGVWRASVAGLSPGRYRYKFVVDGTRWVDDRANGLKEPDEFGGFNSLLNVV